jgi:lysozyme family protein
MGVEADGYFGSQTQSAIVNHGFEWLRRAFNAERLNFMTGLKNWPEDSRGWVRRVAANLRRA